MKKTFKKIICLLAATVFAVGTFSLSSCENGEHNSPTPTPTPSVTPTPTPEPEKYTYKTPTREYTYWAEKASKKGDLLKEDESGKEISYQFTSTYNQEGSGLYYVLVNMYADGYVRVYQYRGILFEYGGYWVNDGDDTGLWVGVLEYGFNNDGTIVYTYNYSNSLIAEDGKFTFTYSISLGGADGGIYVRAVEFNEKSGEVAYKTVQDWINYVQKETGENVKRSDFSTWTGNEEKEVLVSVSMTDKDGTSRKVEFLPDNKTDFGGVGGTWDIIDGALVMSAAEGSEAEWIVTANSDGSYSVIYDYHNSDGTVFNGTLSAEDFETLSSSFTVASVKLYFGGNTESSVTQTIVFAPDGTYSVGDGKISGTWSVENGMFIGDEMLSYDTKSKTLTLSAGTYSFSAVLTDEEIALLGINPEVIVGVKLYFGGNTESSVTQTIVFGIDGTYSVGDGKLSGSWSVENNVFNGGETLSYNAESKTLTLSAGGYSFSTVLTDSQLTALGITS